MRVAPATLTHLRERSGYSMTALAAKAGISKAALWKLENGVTKSARPTTVKAIADALALPIAAFVLPEEAA